MPSPYSNHVWHRVQFADERMEILSLVATLDGAGGGCHMHISLGDKDGNVRAPHATTQHQRHAILSMVQWCSGAVVQGCSGAVVQWCSGGAAIQTMHARGKRGGVAIVMVCLLSAAACLGWIMGPIVCCCIPRLEQRFQHLLHSMPRLEQRLKPLPRSMCTCLHCAAGDWWTCRRQLHRIHYSRNRPWRFKRHCFHVSPLPDINPPIHTHVLPSFPCTNALPLPTIPHPKSRYRPESMPPCQREPCDHPYDMAPVWRACVRAGGKWTPKPGSKS